MAEEDDVLEQSEECLLDRHEDCSGMVTVATSPNIQVRVPCRCFHHQR